MKIGTDPVLECSGGDAVHSRDAADAPCVELSMHASGTLPSAQGTTQPVSTHWGLTADISVPGSRFSLYCVVLRQLSGCVLHGKALILLQVLRSSCGRGDPFTVQVQETPETHTNMTNSHTLRESCEIRDGSNGSQALGSGGQSTAGNTTQRQSDPPLRRSRLSRLPRPKDAIPLCPLRRS
jgi:hypothetical protein